MSLDPNRSLDPLVIAAEVKASRGLDSTICSRTDEASVKESIRIAANGDNRIEKIDFEFESARDGAEAPTQDTRAEFKDDVCQEIIRLQNWAADLDWVVLPVPALNIIVSDRFSISKSLVPAWSGHPGYMEFPTWRIAARRAAIMHELVHVFYPSGNRFLAEGLAVHLQDSIGGNPAFPNFGKPLQKTVIERILEMTSPNSGKDLLGLGQFHLADLDRIATPSPLTLQVGSEIYGEDQRGQAFVYPIAGSFVQFLIEVHGIEKFCALYRQAPLIPLARSVGSLDRWPDVYRLTLADLENQWKSTIVERFLTVNEKLAETPIDRR